MQSHTIAHLVAEYWPFAQTGGLADAARGIATHQAAAGTPTVVFLPFYRKVRERFPNVEPVGQPFQVRLGSRVEEGRLITPAPEEEPATENQPRIFFVQHDGFFDRPGIYGEDHDYADNPSRFAFFCLAALRGLPMVTEGRVLLHAHDWHTALASVYLRTVLAGQPYFDRITSVLSVHNAGYQGTFAPEALAEMGLDPRRFDFSPLEWYGGVNLLKGGLVYSDMATTVSPGHAHELRTPAGGFGLHETFLRLQDSFVGILNGIDLRMWNPETDTDIASNFSQDELDGKRDCKRWLQDACDLAVDPEIPMVGMVARLVQQKGLDLILEANILAHTNAQFVFLGTGEQRYADALTQLASSAPDRVLLQLEFSHARERRLLAGADILLMPSLYEPCGLTQMRAQRYGTLPVARRVGGLADTIEDQVTGFLFDEYAPEALERGLVRATDLFMEPQAWRWHVIEAMGRDFSWERSIEKYFDVYGRAEARRSQAL